MLDLLIKMKMMKKISLIVLLGLFMANFSFGQKIKPYILAATLEGQSITAIQSEVEQNLKSNGFELLGHYRPMNSNSRLLIAVSHPELVKAVEKSGGFTGFAAALRVALTKNGNSIELSYTNPEYWGAAYFQKKYNSLAPQISAVKSAFEKSFSAYGSGEPFGSKKGLTLKNLQGYHYMMGMPYFDDNVKLGSFSSFDQAVQRIEQNFKTHKDLVKVYEKSIPSKQMKLYGVGLRGEEGESTFMPVIDVSNPKHTAFLPYELLVYKNEVYMLHGRFRIALSFPDLSMGTFMKIVSTPSNIEDALKMLCE
jgi:hypothetical protein